MKVSAVVAYDVATSRAVVLVADVGHVVTVQAVIPCDVGAEVRRPSGEPRRSVTGEHVRALACSLAARCDGADLVLLEAPGPARDTAGRRATWIACETLEALEARGAEVAMVPGGWRSGEHVRALLRASLGGWAPELDGPELGAGAILVGWLALNGRPAAA